MHFLLSNPNIAHVKRELRKRLPKVKSSHLSEAIAFAVGHHTHASLLATLNQTIDTQPTLATFDAKLLLNRLTDLCCEQFAISDVPLGGAFEQMPDPMWQEAARNDRQRLNDWFFHCQRRNMPYITITIRRKYAKTGWDCITINPDSDHHARGGASNKLLDVLFEKYQRIACSNPARSEFFGSAFAGSIDRVIPSIARELATELFVELYSPVLRPNKHKI